MSGGLGVGVSCEGVIRMVCQCKFVLVGHSSQQNALYDCQPNAACGVVQASKHCATVTSRRGGEECCRL